MNKKHLLFLPCGILAGLLTGYLGNNLTSGSVSSAALEQKKIQPSRPPRFGEKITEKTNITASADTGSGSREEELMDALFRYSRMTTEELSREWKKVSAHYDYKDSFASAKLDYISKKWGELSPRQAILALKENDNQGYIPSIMRDWIKREPQTALAYILEHKNEYDPRYMISVLAPHAPSAVLKWIETLPEDQKTIGFIDARNYLPPDKMPNLVSSLKNHKNFLNDFECKIIAKKWATADWDAASRWIDSLDHLENEKRIEVIQDALSELPLDKALSELEKRNDVDKNSVMVALAERISDESPHKALDWLVAHTNEQQMKKVMNNSDNTFFLNAYDSDLIDHALRLPSSPTKDLILEKMANRFFTDEKSGAEFSIRSPSMEKRLDLVSQIGNQDYRQKALYDLLSHYSYYRPQKTLEQMEHAQLTPEQKKSIVWECKRNMENDTMPYQ